MQPSEVHKLNKRSVLKYAVTASVSLLITACFAVISWMAGMEMVLIILLSVFLFVLLFALILFLWKKTNILRELMYIAHCITNPASKRVLFCPCCGKKYSSFMTGNFHNDSVHYDIKRFEGQRQDVICPFCNSSPRQRIVAMWADENVEMLKNSRVLFFAPERSMSQWFKRRGVSVTTADIIADADLCLDLMKIDQPDKSWDVVFCNHVLEHVDDYREALSELRRILSPEGVLVLSFPIDENYPTVMDKPDASDTEKVKLFGQFDHVRVFGRDSRELVEQAGFDVSTIDISKMPDSIIPIVAPANYDSNKIFLCRVR